MDLREAREAATATTREEAPEVQPPLTPRQITLRLTYPAPDGKTYQGDAQVKILDAGERTQAALRFADLCRGRPVGSFLPLDLTRLRALAWLPLALVKHPDWLSRFWDEDDVFLLSVYEEVMAHDARYFRRDGGEGAASAGEPRLLVARVNPA